MMNSSESPRRYVGTFTLGIACIAAGMCMLCDYFVPGFDPVLAARLAPLVLVALGGEVLYDTAKPARVRLNGFSVALCLFLMGAVFCASFIPLAADWVMHNGGHAIGWYF